MDLYPRKCKIAREVAVFRVVVLLLAALDEDEDEKDERNRKTCDWTFTYPAAGHPARRHKAGGACV